MPKWKGLVILVVAFVGLASWQHAGRKFHGHLLQEREVQFAAQRDLQQAVT